MKWVLEHQPFKLTIVLIPILDGLSAQVSCNLKEAITLDPPPGEIAEDLKMLEELILREVPDPAEPDTASIPWSNEPHHLSRLVTEEFLDATSRAPLNFVFRHVHPLGCVNQPALEWNLDELPQETTTIVRRIDEYAAHMAQMRWTTIYNGLASRSEVALLLPPPADVYLSYRGSRLDVLKLVKQVHDDLSCTGASSFFRVFMDKPDLRSGTWMPQFESELERAGVFVPFLSTDYRDGEIAAWEFDTAMDLRRRKGKPTFIPVLVEGNFSDHDAVSAENGVEIPVDTTGEEPSRLIGRLRALIVDSQIPIRFKSKGSRA